MQKYQLGLNKKSFSLPFNGGEIWCEHLDSLCSERELVIEKFTKDLSVIEKPSASSFIVIDFDETEVDKELLNYITEALNSSKKPPRKVAVVGLNGKMKRHIEKLRVDFALKCIDDYEKAKEWLISG